MMNKYLSTIVLLSILTGTAQLHAQNLQAAPRLVVNITIDQLRTDYIEHFSSLYGEDGFKKILKQGKVYEAASYPFAPVDRASAIASIFTGTTPHYNNIVGSKWIDRASLRPVTCTDDATSGASPQRLSTSTINDELKIFTRGAAIVYSVAKDKDAAILSGGHAADGALWMNDQTKMWTTSTFYPKGAQGIARTYNNSVNTRSADDNDNVTDMAMACIDNMGMGKDNVTDMLSITLSAKGKNEDLSWQTEMEIVYLKLDKTIGSIIKRIEDKVGADNVMFMFTSTGYVDEQQPDYQKFHIPSGTFYINRTADLLNMYLGAIYGQAQYVLTCFNNEIYLDRKLIEQRHISFTDVVVRSKELLVQTSGVRNVLSNPYNPSVSGDLVIETLPGWQIVNENTNETFFSRAAFVPFPIILYGGGIKPEHVTTPVTVDRIAPTIAKAIRIRAPNACSTEPLH